MSIGIGNEHEVSPFQVVLGVNEVLRVTPDGQFVWNPDADRMIEEGDFSFSPAMPHILRALRKREWVGLTEPELHEINPTWPAPGQQWDYEDVLAFARSIEAKLKEKNT
jgi:hypothetical protein